MDVRLPDGRILRNVPEGTTRAQIEAKIGPVMQQAPTPAAPEAPPEPGLWQQARPYIAPIAETIGLVGGGLVGGAGGTLAAPGPGTIGGAALGAGLGYGAAGQLMELGDVYLGGEAPQAPVQQAVGAAKDVATGAALELGGRALVPIAKFVIPPSVRKMVGDGAGWMKDLASGALVQVKSGKILREIAGDKLPAIRSALQNADPGLTAGQAVAGAGVNAPTFQAAETFAAKKLPGEFSDVYQGQEAARLASLEGVTPDLAKAEAWRAGAAQPFYKQADAARVPIDPSLAALMERPAVADAFRSAATTARNKNISFITADGKLTGEGAHIVKLELDAMGKAGPNNPASDVARSAAQTAGRDFLGWLKVAIPEYEKGRAAFARMSPGVNQSNILGELTSILKKPGGGERPGPFLNALGRGEDAVINRLVRQDGTPRFPDLKSALTPDQVAAVEGVQSQLGRNLQMERAASEGAPALADILKISTEPVQSPGWFNAVTTALNAITKKIQGRVSDKTIKMLSEGMLSNKSALEILNTVPASERGTVLTALQASGGGVRTLPSTINALSPQQQNQNALTQ